VADWSRNFVTTDEGLRAIFSEVKTVAVLGAKAQASEPAHYVPAYLATHGYRIVPVNPTLAGHPLFGRPVVPTLAHLEEPVDLIEVFRRSEHLPGHAREILALSWRPRVVWFQLGIRNDRAAEVLARAGLRVVQDRCMMPEHRRLVGGR
jgi:predicted CoA-binding protein